MTISNELSAVRVIARRLSSTARPVEERQAHAWGAALSNSTRALGRGIEFLRAELEGRTRSVEVGDPAPYDGLDLAQAAALLAERIVAEGPVLSHPDDDHADYQRRVAAEVDGFVAAVAASAPQSSRRRSGVAEGSPDADGPGKARTGHGRTAKTAALAAEPRSGGQRRAVLDAVMAVARNPQIVGLTDVEVQRATGLNPNSARPRRVELVDGGWLMDSGMTREHHGHEHVVWVLTDRAARLMAGAA